MRTQINLGRFSTITERVVPVINREGIWNKRYFKSRKRIDDGLYFVGFGDEVVIEHVATPLEIEVAFRQLPHLRGIAYGDSIIPLNFGNAKFLEYTELTPVHFMKSEMGTVVVVRRWENNMLLFHEMDLRAKEFLIVAQVKHSAETKAGLQGIKGVTPEMRYFYLLLSLDLQRIEEWRDLDKLALSKAEREKRIKAFQESFSGRLQLSIEKAGGKLIQFTKRGSRVDVKWSVDSEVFYTILEQDFRVLELGFCADGHDKDHSIASAVLLAKDFIERGVLYKFRE